MKLPVLLQVLCGNTEELTRLTTKFESNYGHLHSSRYAKREQQSDNQDPLQKFTRSPYVYPGRLVVEFADSTTLISFYDSLRI